MLPRLLAGLAVLLCLLALAWETRAKPRNLHPSAAEKTCRPPGRLNSFPCKILDEYLQSTWDI